ncbi:TPA: TIGR03749 family integrating conjugative element protein [Legionella pneumophila]|uniref:TIGR03749 family integrating conjugative element protein n=1 Tax=Legionella pneumophila TaxID=446 RepID=UPI000CEB29CD|nr:TIGR03749 family integrating conjugative element protein [Legionella pneumophila]PPK32513.1 TIGR03749 family integrating conjugative element protein [Legionella pneumophila]HAT2073473.1 TIGR03749 family integrating conjugative element protein [Legionella pneumophila]HAU0283125.1 TIGR03749 family integrating conjugative element protein [Legionella pneumophila]HAU0306408.1 TIGR03749 family integrating conjugative element protein [Legionella pneumophila]
MKTGKWLLAWLALTASQHALALNAEHVLWDKIPIPLDLPLNEERLVHFPQAVSIIDNEAADKIAVLKVQDTLYLKGKETFQNKRLLVQLMPQGEVIILNLNVSDKTHDVKPVDILLEAKENSTNPTQETSNPLDLNAVTLTRFAIQSLYAPQRVLVIPDGLGRVPMQTRKQISLFYGASIEARPLISWCGDSFYVTAVELKNLLNKEMIVDPRQMTGNWQTATFYPTNTLAPRGKEDTTTVFLVSDRPFSTALASGREYVR